MSPPEVWGPAIWNLFHTLIERVNENAYPKVSKPLFNIIVRICKFLPCPECSNDASLFLSKLNIMNIKTKQELKNTFYLFHNYVNAKKRKPLFNYANMNIYKKYKLLQVINNFILAYNTKGNMKLLAESFQRQLIIKDFKSWFSSFFWAFITPNTPSNELVVNNSNINNEVIQDNTCEPTSNDNSEDIKLDKLEDIERKTDYVNIERDIKEIVHSNVDKLYDDVKEETETFEDQLQDDAKEVTETFEDQLQYGVKEVIETFEDKLQDGSKEVTETFEDQFQDDVKEVTEFLEEQLQDDAIVEEQPKENNMTKKKNKKKKRKSN